MSKPFLRREFTNHRDKPLIENSKIDQIFSSINSLNINDLRNLVTLHQIPLGVVNENGDSLIHRILEDETLQKNEMNKLNIIKFLVGNNVNPDLPNKNNITPLHLACLNQQEDIIKYLLDVGVNPNYQDNLGNSPFHYYLNGLLQIYKNTKVDDLVIPSKRVKDPVYYDLSKIKKNIWDNVKDESGIKAITKTIPVTLLLNKDIKEDLKKFIDEIASDKNFDKYDIKTYKEKMVNILNSIENKIKDSDYWNKFEDINLKIDTDNNTITDFKSVFDECKNRIEDSINKIINSYQTVNDRDKNETKQKIIQETNNLIEIFSIDTNKKKNYNKFQKNDLIDIFKKYYSQDNFQNNDFSDDFDDKLKDISKNEFMLATNELTKKYTAKYCLDSADNYIDLNNKAFIGGARLIDLSNLDLSFNDICNIFKKNKEMTAFSDLNDFSLNAEKENQDSSLYFDQSKNFLNKIVYKELYTDDYKFKKIEDIRKDVSNNFKENSFLAKSYLYNKKLNNNLDTFHSIYNLISKIKCDESRLNVQLATHHLYYLAGYINCNKKDNNRSLALTQAMKALFINQINSKINNDKNSYKKLISFWIYFLLSDKKFDELCKDLNKVSNSGVLSDLDKFGDTPEVTIAKCCYNFLEGTVNQNLETKLKNITQGKIYINKLEWLNYAISLHYDNMKQKPLTNHIVDTIFIIRKIQDYENLGIKNTNQKVVNYLQGIDILNSKSLLNKNNKINTKIYELVIGPNSYYEGTLIKDRDFNFINNLSETILPSRRFIVMQVKEIKKDLNLNDRTKNETINFYISKFFESYLLGLNFVDCFPSINENDKIGYPKDFFDKFNLKRRNDVITDNSANNYYDISSNKLYLSNTKNKKFQYPFLGFVGRINNTLNFRSLSEKNYLPNQQHFNVFAVDLSDGTNSNNQYVRHRPSSEFGVKLIYHRLIDRLYNYVYKLIVPSNFIKILNSYKNKIDGRKSLGKIINVLYPILLSLIDMGRKTKIACGIEDDELELLNIFIEELVEKTNSINAYYFINYYLNSKEDVVDIPSFFYYKIPLPNSQEKSLVFDYSNVDLSLNNTYSKIDGESKFDFEKFNKENDSGIFSKHVNNSNTNFNENYIKRILDGQKYISYRTMKTFIRLSKKAALPPSLKKYYYEFYRIMLLDIITKFNNQNIDEDIKNLKKLFNKDNVDINLQLEFQRSKMIENIVKDYFNWYLKSSIPKILSEEINKIKEKFKEDIPFLNVDKDFNTSLNKKYNNFKIENKSDEIYLNFYRINELIKEEDKFLVYSNDYTSNNLERSFYEYKIKKSILKKMLEKSAKPYLKNNENSTPIFSILRNYYYKIFEDLDVENISYNFINLKNPIGLSSSEMPSLQLYNELKNHSNRLLNNGTTYYDVLNKFSFTQHNQIKLLGERFGNNILRNTELSYSIVGYIFNQYLFRKIFETDLDYNSSQIEEVIKFNNINDISNKTYLIKDLINSTEPNDKKIILIDILEELAIIKTKYNEELERIKESINIFKTKFGFDDDKNISKEKQTKQKLNEIVIKINDIDNILKNKSSTTFNLSDLKNNLSPVNYYDKIADNNRISYISYWEDLLRKDMSSNQDFNLILINQTYNINKECNEDQPKLHHLQFLEKSKIFYKRITTLSDRYFKTPKFLEENEMLSDIQDILIHMTKNIICFGFEITIKKCLFDYYSMKFGDDDIKQIIDYVQVSFEIPVKNETMIDILYNSIAKELVINACNIFQSKTEEIEHNTSSAKEIFENYIKLFEISNPNITQDGKFMQNSSNIINFFDTISFNIIENWQVMIENYMKFSINQYRIIETFLNLNR